MFTSFSSLSILVLPLNNNFDISTKSNDNESTASKIFFTYFKLKKYILFLFWRHFLLNQTKNSLPDCGKNLFIKPLDENWVKTVNLDGLWALLQDLTEFLNVDFEKNGLFEKFLDWNSNVKGKFIQDDIAELFVIGLEFLVGFLGFFLEILEFLIIKLIDCDAKAEVVVGDGDELLVGDDCFIDSRLEFTNKHRNCPTH